MAFRAGRNQQEFFGAFLASPPKNETLIQVKRLVDWKVLRAIMAPVYKDASRRLAPGQLMTHISHRTRARMVLI